VHTNSAHIIFCITEIKVIVRVTICPIKPLLTHTVKHKDAVTLPYAVGNACVETEGSAVRMQHHFPTTL
jgi:hypothetical protein